ncbi:hypothetical protein [Novispirillum itersonii]|uniref:STAS/SEC14 domain-containing protein n=1 Tax=Novispirillum itersonii TaxID=189 RepID=A0A7X0DMQ5_NOVIT|nr:hypothetical protein [Novispirillum itersonii]MBB6211215.1 hypothetical protein [Novispirillum itersonii]
MSGPLIRYSPDTSRFPLVILPAAPAPLSEADSTALIATLTTLLEDGRPYVLIAENGPPPLCDAGTRAFTHWFRQERDRLHRLCRGMVMLLPAGPAVAAAEQQVARMTAAPGWPYPVVVHTTADSARAWAEARLCAPATAEG